MKIGFVNETTIHYKKYNPELETPTARETLYFMKIIFKDKDIVRMFNKVFKQNFEYLKRHYKQLRRTYTIAFDCHDIAYFGKRTTYAVGCENKNGTNKAIRYMAVTLVENPKLILGILPVTSLDEMDNVFDNLLLHVESFVRIDKILCDRAFSNSKIIKILRKRRKIYIMPIARNNKIIEFMRKAEGSKSRIFKDYLHGSEKTNLVIVEDEEGKKVVFSTNWDINENITQYLFKYYSRRWNIENTFRSLVHDFRIKTTSTNYQIRLFDFLYSSLLYNLWIIVNTILSKKLGKTLNKSLITAKTFIKLLIDIKIKKEKNGD